MSEDALAFVLKSDKLRLDEVEILEKVLEWATVNSVRLTSCIYYKYYQDCVHMCLPTVGHIITVYKGMQAL